MSGDGAPQTPVLTAGLVSPAPVPGVDEPVSQTEKQDIADAVEDLRLRAKVGYGLGMVSIAGVGGLAWYSFCSLKTMTDDFKAMSEHGTGTLQVFYVSASAHVAITIAIVYMLYQLLRAAERMVLPRHIQDPDLVRTLLGITSPHREVSRLAGQVLSTALGKAKGGGAEE